MESRLSANTRCSAIAMQTLQAGSDTLWRQGAWSLGLYSSGISHQLSPKDVLWRVLEDELWDSCKLCHLSCRRAWRWELQLLILITAEIVAHEFPMWVLDLCLRERKGAEGDPSCSERVDLSVLWWKPCWSLLGRTSDVHSPPCNRPCSQQHHCSRVQELCSPTLIGPLQYLCSLWAEPGSSPPAHRADELSWWEEGRKQRALLYTPCLCHSSSAQLPSRGDRFISRSFRCSLESVR